MLLLLLQRLKEKKKKKKLLTPQTRSQIYRGFEGTFYLHIPGVISRESPHFFPCF
jgi:hypothetical protein